MTLSVLDLGVAPYGRALDLQESLVARKLAGDATDYLLLVEHEPVYTLGRAADVADLRKADDRLGIDTVRVGRGGGVTFHGPGQLVAYPILNLGAHGHDVGRYVRSLEQVLLSTCEHFDVAAARRPGAPGVWVGDKKIGSIGIQVRRWIAFHGVALNVSTDLTFFSAIAPCRMPDVRMTNLTDEASRPISLAQVRDELVESFRRQFDPVHLQPRSEAYS